MQEIEYDRIAAVRYALRWALSRNPKFYDFAEIGGDCTSFASQSVYAGCGVMNYTPTFGWYYISPNDKSPSWSGVEYFFNFITENSGIGPYGETDRLDNLEPGDIIQLGRENGSFYHTLVLTAVRSSGGVRSYYVCAHDNDAYQRNLDTYDFAASRGIHIEGARIP